MKLIELPPSYGKGKEDKGDGWVQTEGESYQMLHFEANSLVDPFTAKLVNFEVFFFFSTSKKIQRFGGER